MAKSGTLGRVLRPLFGWLLVLLVLFGIRLHQKLMRDTRLDFTATLNGQPLDATATLDGHPFFSGQNISLGSHTFEVGSPHTESSITKFFARYGRLDLGEIKLTRSLRILGISAQPPANKIIITGPEFSTTWFNSPGTNILVPTGDYVVTAEYAFWSQTQNATVGNDQAGLCLFLPKLGALHLTANKDPVTYRLQFPNGSEASSGNLPATISGLPVDDYQLTTTYRDRPITQTVSVNTGRTDDVPIKYVLGMAHIETVPSGAAVREASGNYLGQTPLDILDKPETVQLNLSMNGYDSVDITTAFIADQTNNCRTNLINTNYRGAMQNARRAVANGDYRGAMFATAQALNSMPNDTDALALQTDANAHLAAEKDAATKQQQAATEQQNSLADQAAKDKAEQERLAQLNRPREIFNALCRQYPDARLFVTHNLKTNRPAKAVTDALVKSLPSGFTAFEILRNDSPKPDIYEITARYTLPLGILGGTERVALIVVGQAEANRTQIYFKVLEYQIKAGLGSDKQLIPVSTETMQLGGSRQEQIKLGIKIVNERIQTALDNG